MEAASRLGSCAISPTARLLIVKLSSLGDVAQALPVATALRRRYPQARITWAVERRAAALVTDHPAIDRVVCFPEMSWSAANGRWARDFTAALRGIRAEAYDLCLDLQGLLKSAVVALVSRSPQRLVTARAREGAQLAARRLALPGRRLHAVEEYLHYAGCLGAPTDAVEFGVPVSAEASGTVVRRLDTLGVPAGVPLIIVNPSASTRKKTWPVDRWAKLTIELAGLGTVVLIGAATQRERHAAVVRAARGAALDLTGLPLEESIALLARCTVHVAPDTGTAHIAAALGRSVVGIFGPTPRWRLAPYGNDDLIVSRDDLCGGTCPRLCLRGRACLAAITIDAVVSQVRLAVGSRQSAVGGRQ